MSHIVDLPLLLYRSSKELQVPVSYLLVTQRELSPDAGYDDYLESLTIHSSLDGLDRTNFTARWTALKELHKAKAPSRRDFVYAFYGSLLTALNDDEEAKAKARTEIELLFRSFDASDLVLNIKDIVDRYDDWYSRVYLRLRDEAAAIYQSLRQRQKILANYSPVDHSDAKITSTELKITFAENLLLKNKNYVGFFQDLIPTAIIPEIVLYYEGYTFIKVYSRVAKDEHAIVAPLPAENGVITLRTRVDNPHRKSSTRSYSDALFDLKSRVLTINLTNTEGMSTEEFRPIIEELLKLKIEKIEESPKSSFYLYNVDFDTDSFFYFLLNSPFIRDYLVTRETSSIYANRSLFNIYFLNLVNSVVFTHLTEEQRSHFKTESLGHFTISAEDISEGNSFTYRHLDRNETTSGSVLKSRLEIRIVNIGSRWELLYFHRLFPLLFAIYSENRATVRERIDSILDITPVQRVKVKPIKTVTGGKRGLAQLKATGLSMFGSYYSRACQSQGMPFLSNVTNDEEYEQWVNEAPTEKNRRYRILKYSEDDKHVFLQCNDVEGRPRYPGFKELDPNKEYSEKLIERGINSVVCCYNGIERYNGPIKKKTRGSEQIKNISSVLAIHQEGIFDDNNSIFTDGLLLRHGSLRGKSDLLHCVLYATDPEYAQKATEDMKRAVQRERKVLDRGLEMAALKQENYDYKDSYIRKGLIDTNEILDSYYYVRALELQYSLHIFVFLVTDAGKYEIEVPHSYPFYCRVLEYDRSIMIYKYSDHYELVSLNKEYIMNEKRTAHLMERFVFGNVATWILDGNQLNGYFNLADLGRSLKLKNVEYRGQFLDVYGKARGLVLEIDKKLLVISFPPTTPFNLPEFEADLPLISVENLRKYMQADISAEVTNALGQVIGLWFTDGALRHAYFVPVIPHDHIEGLKEGPSDHYFVARLKATAGVELSELRFTQLKRIRNVLLQLLYWLWTVNQATKKEEVETFLSRIVIKKDIDYDISNLSDALPEVETLGAALDYLQLYLPSLVNKGQIRAPNEKIYKAFLYFLRRTAILSAGKSLEVLTMLRRDHDEMLLPDLPGIYSFSSVDQLNSWLLQERSPLNIGQIERSPDPSKWREGIPSFYQGVSNSDENECITQGAVYMIQLTPQGSLNDAIAVGVSWQDEKLNNGARQVGATKKLREQPYVINELGANNEIYRVTDVPDEEFASVLRFSYRGTQSYAAMLPLN